MLENIELGTFPFTLQQRNRFQSGELWQKWTSRYPAIFDSLDVGLAKTQAREGMGYHFYEWLAAILIYESMGYLSLVEQYEFQSHTRKRHIVEKCVSAELFQLITDHKNEFGGVQCPDLFVYSSVSLELPDWFFCEVKGPKDSISKDQQRFFARLANVSGQPVRIVRFRQV